MLSSVEGSLSLNFLMLQLVRQVLQEAVCQVNLQSHAWPSEISVYHKIEYKVVDS